MLRNFFFGATMLFMSSGIVLAQQVEDEELFVLSPGDVVSVSVLEDASLDRQVLVRPDGRVTFPLAGTLPAADRSLEDLQESIRAALASDFIEPPTVTVALVQPSEAAAAAAEQEDLQFIYVIGQVANPGRHPITEPVDVLRALAIAGGPGVFAATSRIQVRNRDENGGEVVRLFDYEAVQEGAGAEMIEVGNGDVVVVPERGLFE